MMINRTRLYLPVVIFFLLSNITSSNAKILYLDISHILNPDINIKLKENGIDANISSVVQVVRELSPEVEKYINELALVKSAGAENALNLRGIENLKAKSHSLEKLWYAIAYSANFPDSDALITLRPIIKWPILQLGYYPDKEIYTRLHLTVADILLAFDPKDNEAIDVLLRYSTKYIQAGPSNIQAIEILMRRANIDVGYDTVLLGLEEDLKERSKFVSTNDIKALELFSHLDDTEKVQRACRILVWLMSDTNLFLYEKDAGLFRRVTYAFEKAHPKILLAEVDSCLSIAGKRPYENKRILHLLKAHIEGKTLKSNNFPNWVFDVSEEPAARDGDMLVKTLHIESNVYAYPVWYSVLPVSQKLTVLNGGKGRIEPFGKVRFEVGYKGAAPDGMKGTLEVNVYDSETSYHSKGMPISKKKIQLHFNKLTNR